MSKIFNFKQEIIALDDLIRQGFHDLASARLELLLKENPSRIYLADCAALARRLGKNYWALSLLRPFVRPQRKEGMSHATEAERAEYAGALVRIGAVNEAERILEGVNSAKYPRALLFRAFAKVSRWDYLESESHLKHLLTLKNADPYDVLVGKLNLVASLVFRNQVAESFELLRDVELLATQGGYKFILSTVFEFKAELYIKLKQWTDAEHAISIAEGLLAHSDTIDAFLLRKQRTLLNLYKNSEQSKKKTQSILKELKSNALARRHFESVRDCDYHLAVLTSDVTLARHLYHGTPYPSYRARLANNFPELLEDRSDFIWTLGVKQKNNVKTVDIGSETSGLKKGQVPYRLFAAYCSDFYRPKRLPELYSLVFSENNFFPLSSAAQMHQANNRLKKWFLSQNIYLDIKVKDGWSLTPQAGHCTQIVCANSPEYSNGKLPRTAAEDLAFRSINSIPKKLWSRGLSAPEVSELLDTSCRSSRRYLKIAVEYGWIKSIGRGPATKYFDC